MYLFFTQVARYPLRFVLFYWICFIFPFPFDLVGLPFQMVEPKNQPSWMQATGEHYGKAYGWMYEKKTEICKWVGPKVFGQAVIIQPTGSGDTMRSYVGCFCAAVMAAGLALVWTVFLFALGAIQVAWKGDAWLHSVVRVFVRFFLMQMLFSYGFAKVFPLQFAQPSSYRLNQQLGDMSPMGLLWTFMGFSIPYQIFTGAVEVLGGLLLICRRTTLLGALVTIAAMTQIFALNMCFDVPVKLYSLHYLIMGIFLAAPDLPRLINGVVLCRAVDARTFPHFLGNPRLGLAVLIFRTLLVAALLFVQIKSGYKMWSERYGGPPSPVLGQWEKVSLQVDDKDPAADDTLHWKSIDFSIKSMVRVSGPKPPMLVYKVTWDTEAKKMMLTKFSSAEWSADFTYELPASDKLVLNGKMDGKSIKAVFKPMPEKQSKLMTRGFHWVQEMPFNQ